MKGKVGILLFAALIYMMDLVLLPSIMDAGPAGSSCQAAAVKAPGCCHHGKTAAKGRNPSPVCGKIATGKCAAPAGKPGEPCGKNNPRDCNNSANCINCPLCFSATMAAPYHAGTPPRLCKRAYPVLPATPVTDYYSRCWKPPDAGQFS
jgi:hypothetical protein